MRHRLMVPVDTATAEREPAWILSKLVAQDQDLYVLGWQPLWQPRR